MAAKKDAEAVVEVPEYQDPTKDTYLQTALIEATARGYVGVKPEPDSDPTLRGVVLGSL